jgi:hypothetical protein
MAPRLLDACSRESGDGGMRNMPPTLEIQSIIVSRLRLLALENLGRELSSKTTLGEVSICLSSFIDEQRESLTDIERSTQSQNMAERNMAEKQMRQSLMLILKKAVAVITRLLLSKERSLSVELTEDDIDALAAIPNLTEKVHELC